MAFKATNLAKYLERYAEPEAVLAPPQGKRYAVAIVVPVCGESWDLDARWADALTRVPPSERWLFVLVVNSDVDTNIEYLRANDSLLSHWRCHAAQLPSAACPSWLSEFRNYDVLVLDRHSTPWQQPRKTGVGLARKIGGDLVCAWFKAGAVKCAWWLSTDADVILPAALIDTWSQLPTGPAIALLPFEHIAGEEREVDVATQAVELGVRYHVLGLQYAESTYAWPALGSCLVVHAETYAAVRGFPRRLAGEDFYLLSKASKLGPILTLHGAPVRIVARRSSRTPFGTGQAVNDLLRSGDPEGVTLRNPACYEWLRNLLHRLRASFVHCSPEPVLNWMQESATRAPYVVAAMEEMGVEADLTRLCVGRGQARDRLCRANDWFDGLRQVQFLKTLDRTLGPVPYRQALAAAPFVGEAASASSIHDAVELLRQASAP